MLHYPRYPDSDAVLKSVAQYVDQMGRTRVCFQESIMRLESHNPQIRRKEKNRLYKVISREKLHPVQIHAQMQGAAAATAHVAEQLLQQVPEVHFDDEEEALVGDPDDLPPPPTPINVDLDPPSGSQASEEDSLVAQDYEPRTYSDEVLIVFAQYTFDNVIGNKARPKIDGDRSRELLQDCATRRTERNRLYKLAERRGLNPNEIYMQMKGATALPFQSADEEDLVAEAARDDNYLDIPVPRVPDENP